MSFQLQSWDVVDLQVVFIYHMQDDVFVGLVGLVAVTVPVAAFHVDFHMARPELVADLDFGLQEVGAGVGVAVACRHHLDRFAFRCLQVIVGQAVLPDIV